MADVLTTLLGAIRDRLATVPGIASAHYPAVNHLDAAELPAAVVYSGSPNAESVLMRNTGGQVIWEPAVMVQVLGPREGDTPAEFAAIDELIVPVVDAFNGAMHLDIDGTPQHIDRVLVSGYRGSVSIPYAGAPHYGAEFYLSIKFRRPAGA